MAAQVTLPLWPTTHECISWSTDDQIAVAGGENVAILSPQINGTKASAAHRETEIIQANAFTAGEVAVANPLSFANFSIGEEQSQRHVQALAWSAPGLARHRRCALAILSSNHILSIWESDGRTSAEDNWKRRLVVNHAIKSYYKKDIGNTEQLQVSQRISSFAWSPPTYEQVGGLTSTDWGHQYLAVATEIGDIVLLSVQSPYNLLSPSTTEWKVNIIRSFSIKSIAIKTLDPDLAAADQSLENSTFVADNIIWGSRRRAGGHSGAGRDTIAFIADRRLFCIRLDGPSDGQQDIESLIPTQSDMKGPLKFCPYTGILVAFSAERIWCIRALESGETSREATSHHIDGRWDEITGLAFSGNDANSRKVHFTSHLSTSSAETTTLPLPFDDRTASERPAWQDAIHKSRISHSSEYTLGDKVQDRVCGIATSPLGIQVATCSTMFPLDSVSYYTQAEQKSVLNITMESVEDGTLKSLPKTKDLSLRTEISSEGMVIALQHQLNLHSKLTGGATPDHVALASLLSRVVKPPLVVPGLSIPDNGLGSTESLKELVNHIRTFVYCTSDLQNARFEILAMIALKRSRVSHEWMHASHSIVAGLAKIILSLPFSGMQDNKLSNETMSIYMSAHSLLNGGSSTNGDARGVSVGERCEICEQDVPLESFKWARCRSGHQFSRCSLTFLAIQKPGISKQCCVCGSYCLNERVLPEFTTQDEGNAAEPIASLTRIMFTACDTCIYCGGKFVA